VNKRRWPFRDKHDHASTSRFECVPRGLSGANALIVRQDDVAICGDVWNPVLVGRIADARIPFGVQLNFDAYLAKSSSQSLSEVPV
jgi:hypothetical protein